MTAALATLAITTLILAAALAMCALALAHTLDRTNTTGQDADRRRTETLPNHITRTLASYPPEARPAAYRWVREARQKGLAWDEIAARLAGPTTPPHSPTPTGGEGHLRLYPDGSPPGDSALP